MRRALVVIAHALLDACVLTFVILALGLLPLSPFAAAVTEIVPETEPKKTIVSYCTPRPGTGYV